MYGLLKNVWRCLLGRHRVLHYDPITAKNITITCAVLHNIRFYVNMMHFEYNIDKEGEAEALERKRERAQAEELADTEDIEYCANGDRLIEARRIQRQIHRNQFGLRNM